MLVVCITSSSQDPSRYIFSRVIGRVVVVLIAIASARARVLEIGVTTSKVFLVAQSNILSFFTIGIVL